MTHTTKNNINNIFFDVFKRLSVSSYRGRWDTVYSPLLVKQKQPIGVCASDSISFFDSLGIDDVTPVRKKHE